MKLGIEPFVEGAGSEIEEDEEEISAAEDDQEATADEVPAQPKPEPAPEPEPVYICEVKEFEAKYNLKGAQVIKEVGAKPEEDEEEAQEDEASDTEKPKAPPEPVHAMKSVKYFGRQGGVERLAIEVRSKHIQTALKTVVKSFPGQSFSGKVYYLEGETEGQALACFYHYRKELREYAKALEDLTARLHVMLAIKYADRELKVALRRFKSLVELSDTPALGFSDLWLIFKPGDLLYWSSGDQSSIFKLITFEYSAAGGGFFATPAKWRITASRFAYDGKSFGYMHRAVSIEGYSGLKAIKNLPMYPLRFRKDAEQQKEDKIARGKKYCSLARIAHCEYAGTAWQVQEKTTGGLFGPSISYINKAFRLDGRIIIDHGGFTDNMTSDDITLTSTKNVKVEDIDDEDHVTCHHELPGYSLSEKRWCWFQIEHIKFIEFQHDAFDSLLISPTYKRLVRALTTQHLAQTDKFDDMIKGKGKGCIFVLHGEPGVGKTFTAESIAEAIEAPLYVMMSGDLGSDLSSIEKNLKTVLALVTRWKAILLIDEADVFLEERSSQDLARNSLVSIFLRILEYYTGILFLTTNRIHSFDGAFQSRVHLALKFPPLDTEARLGLWHLFLKRTANYKPEAFTEADLNDLASQPLNGRQIKNAVRTANTLALAEKAELNADHIRLVLTAICDFDAEFVRPTEDPKRSSHQKLDNSGSSSLQTQSLQLR